MNRRTGVSGGARAAEALRLDGVSKAYGAAGNTVKALDGVDLSLPAGSFTAVMGPSGSGKTTLLHCAAGLERPDAGRVAVDGAEIGHGSEAALAKFRRDRVGFVFQQYNLLPILTVGQNVVLPLKLAGRKIDAARVDSALRAVGLADRTGDLPEGLSGGQRQRVAIARALVTDPGVVFADEPTGALDLRSAGDVLALLRTTVREHGTTVVMVTHDPVAASYADAVVFLADGRIAGSLVDPSVEAVAERLVHLGDRVDRHHRAGV
nr:ABC transporter ATP-binding protein [Streptomyces tsukubensis]